MKQVADDMVLDMYSYRTASSSNNNNPSFSSTLLDSIYRSIDQGEAMRKKPDYGSGGASTRHGVPRSDEETANFQRACMIEKWMEKKKVGGEKAVRKSADDSQAMKYSRKGSSSSSSDSSCETFPVRGLKPVRTGGCAERLDKIRCCEYEFDHSNDRRACAAADQLEHVRDIKYHEHEQQQKKNSESGFRKTKSRALKIYGDLKKAKQPISPGGKLAAFLNSIFTGAGNVKKPKTSDDSPSVKSTNTSTTTTCSSASSFSRSCLSKTPSSRGKSSSGGAKRSVRFSPVIMDDEDCGKSSVHKFINNKNDMINLTNKCNNNNISTINEDLMVHVMEKNRRVEEIARDLLRSYQKKIIQAEDEFDHMRKVAHQAQNQRVFDREFDEDDDEDDAASYASSDLFELDNLSAIGMERYTEELPVYETTHLDTNRAIASGLIL